MLNMQRGAALVAVAATLAGALVGCNKSGTSTSGAGGLQLDPNANIATVNGTPITQTEFFTDLQAYVTPPQMGGNQEPAGRAVLRQLIQNALVEQLAKSQNVYPTQADIDSQYANYQLIQESNSVKPFADQLAELGVTPDAVKSLRIVPQLCQLNLLTKGVTVTDADLKAYYDLHKSDEFSKPDRAHIMRMILATKADADDVYAQIQKGTPFEQLYSRSIDKQLANGELPQWLPLSDMGASKLSTNPQIAPLITAVKKTDIGKTTPPLQFQGGWWLVKVVDKKPAETWPYEKAEPLVKVEKLQQGMQSDPTRYTDLQNELRDKETTADIKVFSTQYQSLVDSIKNPPPPPPSMPQAGPPPGVRIPGHPVAGGPPPSGGPRPTSGEAPSGGPKPAQ
jgi:parvulin-like peptidyl-prolyl isomerase